MNVTTSFFEQPRLRDAVSVAVGETHSVIRYEDREYEIELDPNARDEAARLLDLLKKGGHSAAQLLQACPRLGEEIRAIDEAVGAGKPVSVL